MSNFPAFGSAGGLGAREDPSRFRTGQWCAGAGMALAVLTVVMMCVVVAKKGGSAVRGVTFFLSVASTALVIASAVLVRPFYGTPATVDPSGSVLLPARVNKYPRTVSWAPAAHVQPFSAQEPPAALSVALAPPTDPVPLPTAPVAPVAPQEDPDPPVPPEQAEADKAVEAVQAMEAQVAAEEATGPPPRPRPYWGTLPNPEALREERERFMQRPDMPALDRQRREMGLREAAASLRPPRDGYMVPIAG